MNIEDLKIVKGSKFFKVDNIISKPYKIIYFRTSENHRFLSLNEWHWSFDNLICACACFEWYEVYQYLHTHNFKPDSTYKKYTEAKEQINLWKEWRDEN